MSRKIIHDEDGMNTTLFLALSWRLPGICQVENCENPTSAIVCLGAEESPTCNPYKLCICEEHYQKAVEDGKLNEKFNL